MLATWSPARVRRRRLTNLAVRPLEERVTPDVSGTVFRDNNFDGAFLPALNDQPFYAGVVVTAFNAAGASATGTTDANGTYTVATAALGTGPLRLELSLPTGYADGPVGTDTEGSVRFLTSATQTGVNFGLVNPLDYSQAAPDLVVTRFSFGSAAGSTNPALYRFAYDADGTPFRSTRVGANPVTPTTLATAGQIGSTYGVAYNRTTETVYTAEYLRRYAGTVGGLGAIYRVPAAGLAASDPAPLLIDLNNVPAAVLGGNTQAQLSAGTDTRGAGYDYFNDTFGRDNLHRLGLGDAELAEDGRTLYVVNLRSRELVEIPLAADGTLDTASGRTLRRTPVPLTVGNDPLNFGNPQDVRPFALSVHDGVVYVGSTYTAETTGTRSTLRAYVHAFDPAAGQFRAFDQTTNRFTAAPLAPVLATDLSYTRLGGTVSGTTSYVTTDTNTPPGTKSTVSNDRRGQDDGWLPWDNVHGPNIFRKHQPLLSDIEFDRGVMVLGLRDRHGDQVGWNGQNVVDTGAGEGDLLRAHPDGTGGFTLESGGTSAGVTNSIGGSGAAPGPVMNPQGPGGGRFYWSNHIYGRDIDNESYGFAHNYLSMGGLFQVPGGTRLATTIMDPVRYSTGGVSWFDNRTGSRPQNYELYADGDLGKANGLGDLQGVVEAAPVEVGNRIWRDSNGDGRQTAGELGIGGVVVVLTDGAGAPLATATTAADGSYIFSGYRTPGDSTDSRRYGLTLQPGGSYRVVIPGYATQAVLNGLALSPRQVDGPGSVRDSDALGTGADAVIAFTAGGPGQNDHTLDAGFAPPPPPNVAVAKTTSTPLVNAGEAVAYTVVVSNSGTVPANGVTLADSLPGGVTWSISGNAGPFVLGGSPGSQTLTLAVGTNLAVGGSLSVTLVGTAGSSASPLTVTLQNTATVAVPGETDTSDNSSRADITVRSPDVTAQKVADASSVPDGSQVGFTVTVSNAGPGLATGVTLNDPLPPLGNGNLWTLAPGTPANTPFRLTGPAGSQVLSLAAGTTLAAGAQLQVRVVGTATTAQLSLPNTATVGAGNENSGATGNNQASATVTVTVRPPDVTVTKTADASTVIAGDQVGFTVTVLNVGPNPATGVTLNDPLPALGGGNLYSIDPASPNASAFVLTGPAGSQVLSLQPNTTLAAGGQLRVRLTGVSVGTPSPYTQTLTNRATVGATNDGDPSNNQATATVTVQSPDVTVTKTASPATVTAGGPVAFTLTVRNIGLALARAVALSDQLPALGGGNLYGIDPASPNAGAFVLSGPAGSQVLSLRPATDLAAGGSLTVRLVGTSVSSASPFTQSLPNSATVSAANEGDTSNNQSQATVTVVSPDVTAQKQADAGTVSAGQQVGFTVTLSNAGPGDAVGLTLSDPLPALGGGNVWSIDPASPNAGAFQLVAAGGGQSLQLEGHVEGRSRTG